MPDLANGLSASFRPIRRIHSGSNSTRPAAALATFAADWRTNLTPRIGPRSAPPVHCASVSETHPRFQSWNWGAVPDGHAKSQIEKLEASLSQTDGPPPMPPRVQPTWKTASIPVRSHGQNDLWQLAVRPGAKKREAGSPGAAVRVARRRKRPRRASAFPRRSRSPSLFNDWRAHGAHSDLVGRDQNTRSWTRRQTERLTS